MSWSKVCATNKNEDEQVNGAVTNSWMLTFTFDSSINPFTLTASINFIYSSFGQNVFFFLNTEIYSMKKWKKKDQNEYHFVRTNLDCWSLVSEVNLFSFSSLFLVLFCFRGKSINSESVVFGFSFSLSLFYPISNCVCVCVCWASKFLVKGARVIFQWSTI